MAEFLVKETDRYVTCNKNKPEFSVSMEEIMQFIGLIFCQSATYAFLKETAGAHLRCDFFCTTMIRNHFFEIKAVLPAANN